MSRNRKIKPFSVAVDENRAVSVAHAAVLFSVSEPTVRKWINLGCPVVEEGGSGRGNATRLRISDIHSFLIKSAAAKNSKNDEEDYDEVGARAADWHYRAILRQTQALEKLDLLIPVDVIEKVVAEEYSSVRSSIMSLPARLNVSLAAESDARIVYETLKKELAKILVDMSDPADVVVKIGATPGASINDAQLIDDDMTELDQSEETDEELDEIDAC